MNMDLGSAIVGAIIITICMLPFIMIGRSRKKKEKQFIQALQNNANKHNCQINQQEVFGTFAIGMDEEHNTLFFSRSAKEKEEEQFVDLSNIKKCEVINTGRTFRNKNGNKNGTKTIIDKLELGFIPKAKDQPEIKWEFFNADISYQINGELHAMQKWATNINNLLSPKS